MGGKWKLSKRKVRPNVVRFIDSHKHWEIRSLALRYQISRSTVYKIRSRRYPCMPEEPERHVVSRRKRSRRTVKAELQRTKAS